MVCNSKRLSPWILCSAFAERESTRVNASWAQGALEGNPLGIQIAHISHIHPKDMSNHLGVWVRPRPSKRVSRSNAIKARPCGGIWSGSSHLGWSWFRGMGQVERLVERSYYSMWGPIRSRKDFSVRFVEGAYFCFQFNWKIKSDMKFVQHLSLRMWFKWIEVPNDWWFQTFVRI